MNIQVGFTRDQIIDGLLTPKSRFFMDGKKVLMEKYLDYWGRIYGTLGILDKVASRLQPSESVALDALRETRFSIARLSGCGITFELYEGTVARIEKTNGGKDDDFSFSWHDYSVEFEDLTIYEVSFRHRDSGIRIESSIRVYEKDGMVRNRTFTLADLRRCISFRSFGDRNRRMREDGLVLPQNIINGRLLHDLLEEADRLGFILAVPLSTVLRRDIRTKYDLITGRGKVKDIPRTVDSCPLVIGYMMKSALEVFGKEALDVLRPENADILTARLEKKDSWKEICNNGCHVPTMIDEALAICLYDDMDADVATDYIRMCRKAGIRADLSIRSRQRLQEEIMRLERITGRESKLNVVPCFRNLARRLGDRYTLIENDRQLEDEGLGEKKNSYYSMLICLGLSALFTYDSPDGRHCIFEVGGDYGYFHCSQLSEDPDAPASAELKELEKLLEEINAGRKKTAPRKDKAGTTSDGM